MDMTTITAEALWEIVCNYHTAGGFADIIPKGPVWNEFWFKYISDAIFANDYDHPEIGFMYLCFLYEMALTGDL